MLLASPFILTSQGVKGWGYFKSAHFSPSKFQVINYMSDLPGNPNPNPNPNTSPPPSSR